MSRFEIEFGKDGLTPGSNIIRGVPSYSANSLGENVGHAFFLGRCYSCRQVGHSQKWCPIQRSRTCGRYGHTSRAYCTHPPRGWLP